MGGSLNQTAQALASVPSNFGQATGSFTGGGGGGGTFSFTGTTAKASAPGTFSFSGGIGGKGVGKGGNPHKPMGLADYFGSAGGDKIGPPGGYGGAGAHGANGSTSNGGGSFAFRGKGASTRGADGGFSNGPGSRDRGASGTDSGGAAFRGKGARERGADGGGANPNAVPLGAAGKFTFGEAGPAKSGLSPKAGASSAAYGFGGRFDAQSSNPYSSSKTAPGGTGGETINCSEWIRKVSKYADSINASRYFSEYVRHATTKFTNLVGTDYAK